MTYFIGIAFILILLALGSAGFFMLRGGAQPGAPKTKKMARALAIRVGLSITLFALIWLSYLLGWIEPSGIRLQR
jgi:hypothetical protein